MGANGSVSLVARIGDAAGIVWHYLDQNGAVSMTHLIEELDVPRDLLMQAVGWLAREDKITLEETSRRKTVALRR